MADTSVADQPPPLAVAQAPSFCRLCDVELPAKETWRAHFKSDEHVYKLQLKVAEPGSVTQPAPPPEHPSTDTDQSKGKAPLPARVTDEPDDETRQDQDQDDGDDDEPTAPEFAPGNCLFCAHESAMLDDTMSHMAAAHGFTVPFQDCLAVDLETVVSYLHFVVHGYRECICCGARRPTVEGVQHHMVAKGHCRFDISLDTEEFYEMPQSANVVTEQAQRDGDMPVRLPSGKLISHRKHPEPHEPRVARHATPDADRDPFTPLGSRPSAAAPGQELVERGGAGGSSEMVRSSEAILAAQLSRLRTAGVREQQKGEARRRGRLESANNVIGMKRFRVDAGDSRFGRQIN